MKLFLISFLLIGLSLAGMAVGLFLKRGCIKGSCGGLNNIAGTGSECRVCGRPSDDNTNREA